MRTITVQFETSPGRAYDYFVPKDDNPVAGDFVVTSLNDYENTMGALATYKVGKIVTEVHEQQSPKATKFYISLISKAGVLATKKANAEYKEKEDQRKMARSKLDAMLKAQSDMERYERLMQNPEAAELIKLLKDEG